jgi:hypothetical protein
MGLMLCTPLLTGCQQYHWRHDFEKAEIQGREQNKYLFIFYKWFMDNDSNRMLGNEVLSDPAVVAMFQNTINLLIDEAYGPEYVEMMARYGVHGVPACVLVAPDGGYRAYTGFLDKQRFIEFVEEAGRGDPVGRKTRMPDSSAATSTSSKPAID